MTRQIKNALVLVLLSIVVMVYVRSNYRFAINSTESLSNWAFIIKLGKMPVRAGEYAAFSIPPNPYYTTTDKKYFVKIVGGVGGDTVLEKSRVYYVEGKEIGRAKELSLKGDVLEKGPVGIIPKGQYFMYSPHKDSYDSRYLQIGWIPTERIIGVAIPVL